MPTCPTGISSKASRGQEAPADLSHLLGQLSVPYSLVFWHWQQVLRCWLENCISRNCLVLVCRHLACASLANAPVTGMGSSNWTGPASPRRSIAGVEQSAAVAAVCGGSWGLPGSAAAEELSAVLATVCTGGSATVAAGCAVRAGMAQWGGHAPSRYVPQAWTVDLQYHNTCMPCDGVHTGHCDASGRWYLMLVLQLPRWSAWFVAHMVGRAALN